MTSRSSRVEVLEEFLGRMVAEHAEITRSRVADLKFRRFAEEAARLLEDRGDAERHVREERDFLVTRLGSARRYDPDVIGTSSRAMVHHAMTGTAVKRHEHPVGVCDLNRCERTFERAPEHLRPVMLPTLVEFRRRVLDCPWGWRASVVKDHYKPAEVER